MTSLIQCFVIAIAAAGQGIGTKQITPAVVPEAQIANKSVPGMDRLDYNTSVFAAGGWVFVGAYHGGGVNCFRVDTHTGKLAYRGIADVAAEGKAPGKGLCTQTMALGANGLLYATAMRTHARGDTFSLGLFWYRLPDQAGPPKLLGKAACPYGSLMPAPDRKSFYLVTTFGREVVHYVPDATGAPVETSRVKGKGVESPGAISPDGRFLYTVSRTDFHVACIPLGLDGRCGKATAIPFKDDLKVCGSIRSLALAVSPDGAQAYLAAWGYGEKAPAGKYSGYNALGLCRRDPSSGALTFVKLLPAHERMHHLRSLAFAPDGRTGYFAAGHESSGNCVGWVHRDPKTGKLTFGGVAGESGGIKPTDLAYVPRTGAIYVPTVYRGLYVFRAGGEAATTAPVRRHVFVSGKVQGVGFRAYTRRNALALKLTGWVRNKADGRVEAVIEGPPDRVRKLLEAIGKGPAMSNVTDVKVVKEPHKGEYETFMVTR